MTSAEGRTRRLTKPPMASAFSHTLAALVLGKAFQHPIMTWPVLLSSAVCSIVPDLDVIGFYFGIHYGDLWGHRV